jgi:hypothetical protein
MLRQGGQKPIKNFSGGAYWNIIKDEYKVNGRRMKLA